MATYFVAPYGDDANPGTSPGAPFRTINQAAQVMVDGDVCYVAPGTYRESVQIPDALQTQHKMLYFLGDPEASRFPGVDPGPVVLDGSSGGEGPSLQTGVSLGAYVGIRWDRIDITRFANYAFHAAASGGTSIPASEVTNCRISNCATAWHSGTRTAVTLRHVRMANVAIGVSAAAHAVVSVEDVWLDGGQQLVTVQYGQVTLRDVFMRGSGGAALVHALGGSRGAVVIAIDNALAINAGLIYAYWDNSSASFAAAISRSTSVGASNSAIIPGVTGSTISGTPSRTTVIDTVLADTSDLVRTSGDANNKYVHFSRCARLNVPNLTSGLSPNQIRLDGMWPTTSGPEGELLPDFTPVGAQMLFPEENEPIEGLRSARIEVPRVAYYPFKVAVTGGNTIVFKARKSHPIGTTVKFRVDRDPNKVVTLADTDEVQTVQLGPVDDLGPRFVELEVWAQQPVYIPGHFVLVDSIQVL